MLTHCGQPSSFNSGLNLEQVTKKCITTHPRFDLAYMNATSPGIQQIWTNITGSISDPSTRCKGNMADTNPSPSGTEASTITIPPSYLYALGNRFTRQQVDAFLTSSIPPSFFYGSLMFPKAVSAATQNADLDGIIQRMTSATMCHYQRCAV